MSIAETFSSWKALKGRAQYVIVGTASARQRMQIDAHRLPWTTTDIEVDEVIVSPTGDSPTVFRLRQTGGTSPEDLTAGRKTIVSDSYPLLSPGDRYLLFLTPAAIIPDVYYTVGSYQGIFEVSQDGRVSCLRPDVAEGEIAVHGELLEEVIQAVADA